MDIENPVKERVSAFTGQKSELDHTLLSNSDCEEVRNFTTRKGRLRKCWGRTLYAELAFHPGERISFLERFRNRWIAQQGEAIALESAEGSASFDLVGGINLGAANRIFSEKWQNRIYLTNGVENKVVENTGEFVSTTVDFFDLGITPPGRGQRLERYMVTANPADFVQLDTSEVAAAGAGLTAATLYEYLITFVDSERQIESLPNNSEVGEDGLWITDNGMATGIVTSGANKAIRIDWTDIAALGYDSRVTHVKVYRATQADFTTFKCVNVALGSENGTPVGTGYYVDELAEADLGTVLDNSISPPPSGKYYNGYGGNNSTPDAIGPRFVKFFRDQLWLFGVNLPGTTWGSEVVEWTASSLISKRVNYFPQTGIAYASRVGNHEYWQYSYDVGRSTDQRDTGMAVYKNALMFFKERSVYYLDGSNPDNYEIRELDRVNGNIAEGALQETTIGPIGLSLDGFMVFTTGGGQDISVEIGDVIDSINLEFAHLITSSFDHKEEKYHCHVPTTAAERNTLVCTYDIKTKSWSFSSLAGGAEKYDADSKGRNVGLLGDNSNGRLYTASDYSAVTFNGQTIIGTWRSKHFDFGAPERMKKLHRITITARAIRDFRLSVDVIPDFGEQEGFSIEDVNPNVRSDQWASSSSDTAGMNWDEGQWSGAATRKKFTILAQCVAKTVQIVVRNSDTDADRASFEIEEILLEASGLGDGDSIDSQSTPA